MHPLLILFIVFFLLGRVRSLKRPRLCRFKSDRGKIWHEARDPKGESGRWSSWEGQRSPSSPAIVWGSAVREPRDPRKIWNLVQLETSKVTTEMPYNVQVMVQVIPGSKG